MVASIFFHKVSRFSRRFENFIADLRKQPQDFSLVKELVSPYNLRRTLQGKIGDSEKDLTAPYAVEILIKHKYQKDPSS